jgi:hypothetical protein
MEIKQAAATLAEHDFFDISNNSPRLTRINAETLYSVVMKWLYVAICG